MKNDFNTIELLLFFHRKINKIESVSFDAKRNHQIMKLTFK